MCVWGGGDAKEACPIIFYQGVIKASQILRLSTHGLGPSCGHVCQMYGRAFRQLRRHIVNGRTLN